MGLALGTSGVDFRSRMKLRAEKVRSLVTHKVQSYGTVLLQTLVTETPILTGQAKANWQAVIGQPNGSYVGPGGLTSDPRSLSHGPPQTVPWSTYAGLAERVIANYQVGQVLYIFSNLPYIESLNEGSSKQAPAGFVETAVLQASAAAKGAR